MNNVKTPININLFAGPGTGKSTIAAELFSTLKRQHKKVELVTEYAKDVTYRGDMNTLTDQLYLMGKQHHKLWRLLQHDIDIIIHDSPFIMGLNYVQDNGILPVQEFSDMALKLFNNYRNINIFLERNPENGYQQIGRSQTLQEAQNIDNEILTFLTTQLPFNGTLTKILVDGDCVENIIKHIKYWSNHKGWKF